MPSKFKYVIIGAGPTGIGAAYRLRDYGIDDFIILETQAFPGGLATSFVDEKGFTWDIGGHVQFSHYEYFDKAMNEALGAEDWNHHQREASVWIKNRFVPYPFQNNIHRLPTKERDECFLGLKKRNTKKHPAHLDEWLKVNFGNGIYRHFLGPYNFKVWAYHPQRMSYKWINERVATIDMKRIEKNIQLNRDDTSWGPNNTFRFPKEGGTGAIWKNLAQQVAHHKIKFNSKVSKIDPQKKSVFINGNQAIQYDHLLSSIPLNQLTNITIGVPKELIERASQLVYSSTHIVGIGLEGKLPQSLEGKCWMYFPEENCPFYRVTVFSHYAKNNVPNPNTQFSLMTEISESSEKPVDQNSIVEDVIKGLKNCSLLFPEHKILSKFYFKTEYGYPTPCLKRDSILHDVITYLESLKIYSRGRFGGWKYEVSNQDHTFMQGVEWIERMEEKKVESTYQWK